MMSLSMDGIHLQFDESWWVTKWDDSPWYLDGIRKLNGKLDDRTEGTKAVDAVGLRHGVPYLFEVKDFRGTAIKNKQRQLDELPLEVGLKARDSIAGLLGLVALKSSSEAPRNWIRAVQGQQQSLRVIALLAEDSARPGETKHKRSIRAKERSDRMKQRLAWLTPRVLVQDPLLEAASLASIGVIATSDARSS